MGKSLYGNVINPPKNFQNIKTDDNNSISPGAQEDTLKILGDNQQIKTSIKEGKISIIHNDHLEEIEQTQTDDTKIIEGGIGEQILTYIPNLNIDKQGHIVKISDDNSKITNYAIKPVGKQQTDNGEIFNDYDNNIATDYAHAEGQNTQATGPRAHSEGLNSQAHGPQSHSEGQSAQAFGQGAHSEGYNTYTWDNASHAEGNMGIAIGNGAHAEGYHIYSDDLLLLTIENITLEQGIQHIEREEFKNKLENNQYYYFVFKSNENVWYFGQYINESLILCPYSIDSNNIQYQSSSCLNRNIVNDTLKIYKALGLAKGIGSHIEGRHTEARGLYSHAGGRQSISIGDQSFAHGLNVKATSANSVAFGKYNDIINNQNKLFQIGNGTNEQNRKDAFYVENNQTCAPDFTTYSAIKLSEMPISLSVSSNGREYTINQGNKKIGTIPIALNAMVNKAEMADIDDQGNQGTFIKLTVNTDSGSETLYINLSQILFQAQVSDTDTIDLNIDNQQVITGAIKTNSVQGGIQGHLAANTITTYNIDNINGDKINSNTLPSSSIINNSIGPEQLANNAVGLNNLTNDLQTTINTKMEKNNPVGSGSLSINRKANTDIGTNSIAIGSSNIASGTVATAIGLGNIIKSNNSIGLGKYNKILSTGVNNAVLGVNNSVSDVVKSDGTIQPTSNSVGIGSNNNIQANFSVTIGFNNTVRWNESNIGDAMIAMGSGCLSEGYSSISEGYRTQSLGGSGSHSEGSNTIIKTPSGHVQGRYNVIDETKTLAHIVGNGTNEENRSNAHTLDWKGNAWYAGKVEAEAIVLRSSTPGSTKKFKITINDDAILNLEEVE